MNRRRFLHASAAASAFFGGFVTVAEARLVHRGAGAAAVPLVGPAVGAASDGTWTGVAASGLNGQVVSDATITWVKGKPAVHWVQPSEQRLWKNMKIAVTGGCGGLTLGAGPSGTGIAWVEFYGDCATTRITAPAWCPDLDVNGYTKNYWEWAINLNAAAFAALFSGATSVIKIFARIHPTDSTMQDRILGAYTTVDVSGDTEQKFYPRLTETDNFSKTVSPTGFYPNGTTPTDFSSINAFVTAARGATAESPKALLVTTGLYELADIGGVTGTGNAKGMMVLAADTGITATLGRAAAYDPTGASPLWSWQVGWPGVEFRGKGVVLDLKNWTKMINEKSCFFNGTRITNSAASWPYAWNGGPNPPFGITTAGGSNVQNWYVAAIIDKASPLTGANYINICTKMSQVLGSPNDTVPIAVGTVFVDSDITKLYDVNASGSFGEYSQGPGLNITYSGAGVGSFSATGNSDAGYTFLLKVNGTTVDTITILPWPTGAGGASVYSWAQFATRIATNANFAATVGTAQLSPRWINDYSSGQTLTTSVAYSIGCGNYIHVEWAHMQGPHTGPGGAGQSFQANIVYTNNFAMRSRYTTGIDVVEGAIRDAFIANNGWDGKTFGGYDNRGASSGGWNSFSNNITQIHNYMDGSHSFDSPTITQDQYSNFSRNLVDYMYITGPSTWQTYPAYTYNGLVMGGSPLPNATSSVGNFTLGSPAPSDTAFQAAVKDKHNGDFRPAVSSALLSNLVAPLLTWDMLGNVRPASDVIGPMASNAPTPLYGNVNYWV